jgi:uncharacterized protein (DUF342 family)
MESQPGTITIGGPKRPESPVAPQINELLSEVNTFAARIRSSEERINNLRRSYQLNEQNFVELNKKTNEELTAVNSEIFDLKRSISDIKTKMELIIKELMLTAKKEDVDVLTKYLDMWTPVNFVTQNEVKKIVRRMLYEVGFNMKPDDSGQKIQKSEKESEAHPSPEQPESDEDEFGIHRRL